MTEKRQINLRLQEKQIEELKKLAQSEKRSVNNMIEFIIDEYIKTHEKG